MAFPLVPAAIGGVVLLGTGIALRIRAINRTPAAAKAAAAAGKPLPPAPRSAAPTSATKAIAATIQKLPPNAKQPDGTVTAAELARRNAAEKIRAAQLTEDQQKAIEAAAIPGKTVAEFTGNGTSGAPVLPLGSLKAGDIFPTDHVSLNVNALKAAGVTFIPSDVLGDVLVRAVAPNTLESLQGVSIDPRWNDGDTKRVFPMAAVTGVGPVDIDAAI